MSKEQGNIKVWKSFDCLNVRNQIEAVKMQFLVFGG